MRNLFLEATKKIRQMLIKEYQNNKKHQHIKLFIFHLGFRLAKELGESDNYSAIQVEQTALRSHMPMTNFCYAVCMFCTPEQFSKYFDEVDDLRYWKLREELASYQFAKDSSFTSLDVARYRDYHRVGGGPFGAFGDSGHHGGHASGHGDCGGGHAGH